jgi:F-type H+-transporting ATPase subunit b
MPQLDARTYLSQLFWLGVSFGLLYVCMHFFIVPKVKKIFQKRRYFLEEKLEEIDVFRSEIERLEKKIEVLSEKSRQRANEILTEIQNQCKELIKKEEKTLQRISDEEISIFQKNLEEMEEKIESDLKKKQKDIANLIVQKLLETPESLEKRKPQ